MKHLIQHRYHIEELFFKFVTNKITLVEMIEALKRLEELLQVKEENVEARLWLKFGSDDKLCVTISDLERNLETNNKNYAFTFDRLVEAYTLRNVNNNTALFIYFS